MVAAAARRGTRIPLVYDAHTLLMSELPFYSLGLPAGVKRGLGRWLDRKVPLLADHTVCVTEAIRDKLVRDADYDPGRATVITNGVEFEHFDIAGRQAAPAQQGQMITFTGNMAEYQGIDLLLKAFARVISRKPQARLQIVTDGSFASYEPLAHELGVRGQIDLVLSPSFAELPAIIAAADVAVNPRPYMDGVPVKLLNYMAAGRAVVSFDASAPGVVHGQTGWLARSGDAAEFGDGILRLLDDPALAARIGTEARRYVFENCRWPVVAERCETLYQRLLEATA
jgi:glycosyltransferase involved in cell wall biosynthesis